MTQESITLSYQQGTSDKVYNAELTKQPEGWVVNFAYGRRGNSLNTGTKTKEPVTYEVAKKTYDKLVKSKTAKGYKTNGANGSSISVITDKEDSGIYPQLLNEITEEQAMLFINDPNYCMQEKFDGKRRLIIKNKDNSIQGINKKGIVIALTKEIEDISKGVNGPYIIDGEDMGDVIMLFDNITNPDEAYMHRYHKLSKLIGSPTNNIPLKVVTTAWDKNAKLNTFCRLKQERAEGVVFKHISAFYSAGRPASGGSQYKCKFYETASCIVESISSVKNSIGLKVYDDSHPVSLVGVPVGNATLYPNSPKVKIGDIVEIKYLYYNEGGSLYQPVLLAVRDDVDTDECLLSKLKRKKDETP